MKTALRRFLNDDWMAVFAGFVIIGLTIFIYEYIPALPLLFNPKEKWSGAEFLTGFLSRPNLLRIVYIFLIFPSAAARLPSRGSINPQ